MTKATKLTKNEKELLLRLINVVEASEWDSGDYNFTQYQFDSLRRAKLKLQQE